MYPNLSATPSNEQQFKLKKINEIKEYFVAEIKERKLMRKRFFLCNYVRINGDVYRNMYFLKVLYALLNNFTTLYSIIN